MALSIPQLYAVATGAGFPPDTARKMVAVALGESSGNPQAYNGAGADNSYGLWQVNMIGALGPARVQQFGLSSPSDLFDPSINAAAAYSIWGGDDSNIGKNWSAANAPAYASNLALVNSTLGPAGGVMDDIASTFPAVSLPGGGVDWSGIGGAISDNQTEIMIGAGVVAALWLVGSAFRR